MIRIEKLHKYFNRGRPNELHVINGITLDLPEKGMTAIFGKSGCGKTTLLNVIGGLDRYAEGTLTIEGQSIRENTDDIRNRYIGYIFQNYNLNRQESCFDNVADALRLCGMTDEAEIETRVMAALANVGMEKYAKRPPDTLSGGQQQRIAIARAIVKNPRIILADEPTGNLDEANTVMIMDLLSAIAKEHLVLLVTHEAELVDYYCDTVIELHDGEIRDIRKNASAGGYAARDKSDIWLGELDRRELTDEHAHIEYYGDMPDTPVRMKIVNYGGKLYVQLEDERVHILDASSELKLREGVYERQEDRNSVSESIDMSKLPPVEGTHYGRLFSFRSSVKSGYSSNFKSRKKGRKTLRRCMYLFASVIVFMSTVFGSAFGDLIEAGKAYNHNVFYVYTPNAEVSAKLNEAVGNSDTGIDYVRLTGEYPRGDAHVGFRVGSFETFSRFDFADSFVTNAVFLDASLADDLPLAEGKRDGLSEAELLITTKVADELIEKSTLGYITEREDLIGFVSSTFEIGGKFPRIAGIVESSESAVYLTGTAMAKYVRNSAHLSYTTLASDYGIELSAGEAVLAIRAAQDDVKYPALGETVKIQGRDIKVVGIMHAYTEYADWLEAKGVKKKDPTLFFTDMVKAQMPGLSEGSDKFASAVDDYSESHYYDYYDYYYSEIDAFYRELYFFERDRAELWLYLKKGVEAAKYVGLPDDYYKAVVYKQRYGSYPTEKQMQQLYDTLPYAYDLLKEYMMMYDGEFYSQNSFGGFGACTYMVSEEDYIAFSARLGETHPSAEAGNMSGLAQAVPAAKSTGISETADAVYFGTAYYSVIHSSDPALTASWLGSEFSDLQPPRSHWEALITPDSVFDSIIRDKTVQITASLAAMGVIFVLMSVCMYFIMRSSLMNRIKEVGIYRAIGVSKKNLVFRFFVEACVLTTMTVFVGYLATSSFIAVCFGMSSVVEEIFYYPLWLAGAVLVALYAVSLFFGTLPVLSLLRKSSSEILAKYDI